MFFYGSGALNDRLIEETRLLWSYHPRFRNDLVHNIQGKYSFEQRPQRGIVIRTSSGEHRRLTWDNFQGTKASYVIRAKTDATKPGLSVEFVRENALAIQANNGIFPSPPGIYIIDVTQSEIEEAGGFRTYLPAGQHPTADQELTGNHMFTVSPQLSVVNEGLEMVSPTVGFLEQGGFIPGTLDLYERPSNWKLIEGVNYTADSETGEITLTEALPSPLTIRADYRYEGVKSDPYVIANDWAHHEAIPGAVLAFGRRITPGDQLAVVVTDRREFGAMEYGGRVDINVEIDLWARDVDDQREMLDLMFIWYEGVLRDRLSIEGIEIESVSWSGETEEVYDDNADDYFYGATLSLRVQTDWKLHVPLVGMFKRFSIGSSDQLTAVALRSLDPDVIALARNNLHLLARLGLSSFDDPFFVNADRNFETIR